MRRLLDTLKVQRHDTLTSHIKSEFKYKFNQREQGWSHVHE